jgi:CheY-like chemotaxis protein
MLPRVFDMFAQVDRTLKRAQGGLGIGLALAQSLVELHGGQIEARSPGLDQGSEFVVRLPITLSRGEAPAESGSGKQPAASIAPGRILVVDDSKDGADSLAMVLKMLGADSDVAYDGPSALEAIRANRPAVVLLDIGMPGMDGYEVAARIRADPACRDVRLVALTGWGSEEERRRSREAGFDDHWVKPVDPARLRELFAPKTD